MNSPVNDEAINNKKVIWTHFFSLFIASCATTLLIFSLLSDLFPISIISLFLGIFGLIRSALVMLEDEHTSQVQQVAIVSFIASSLTTIISLIYFFHATSVLEDFGNIDVMLG